MPTPKSTPPPCGAPPVELVVTFERIGRDHDVPPLTVTWTDVHELAAAIHAHARPHLRSRQFQVDVYLDEPPWPGR